MYAEEPMSKFLDDTIALIEQLFYKVSFDFHFVTVIMEENTNDDKNLIALELAYKKKTEEMMYVFEEGRRQLLIFNEYINRGFTPMKAKNSFKFCTQFFDNFNKYFALCDDENHSFQEMYRLQEKIKLNGSLENESTRNLLGNNRNTKIAGSDIPSKPHNLMFTNIKVETNYYKSQSTKSVKAIVDSDNNKNVFLKTTQATDRNDDNVQMNESSHSILDVNNESDAESQESFIFDISEYVYQRTSETGQATDNEKRNAPLDEFINIKENVSKEVQLSANSLKNVEGESSDYKNNYVNDLGADELKNTVLRTKTCEINKLKSFKLLGVGKKKRFVNKEESSRIEVAKGVFAFITNELPTLPLDASSDFENSTERFMNLNDKDWAKKHTTS
ncbi:hypothetical protein FQA39_LY13595 [Lamprigera yunnana]|nr:hypothetical protein FQA39_LY13595 [Lamprigera yunnana]